MTIQYPFSPYPLIAVVSLLFLLPTTLYLLWLRPKTAATYNLIGFMLCIMVNLTAMFLHNAVFIFWLPLWPLQDALVVVAGVFMVRFAYTYPQVDRSREARLVTGGLTALALLSLGWVLVDTWRFFREPHSVQVAWPFWLLMPIATLLGVAVFLRRMVTYANVPTESMQASGWIGHASRGIGRFWQILRHPPNVHARAHRNFALAVLSGTIQALGSLGAVLFPSPLLPAETMIEVGTLLTLSLIVLAYLNGTAADNTLIVRMVGACLIVFLAVMGAVGIQVIQTSKTIYWSNQVQLSDLLIQSIDADSSVDLPDDLAYIATYPKSNRLTTGQIDFLYQKPDLPSLYAGAIAGEIQRLPLPDYLRQAGPTTRDVARNLNLSWGKWAYFDGFVFFRGEQIVELGFPSTSRNATSHLIVSRLIGQVLFGTLVILIVLPLFFQSSLLRPLRNLLQGVHRVNDGDLTGAVPVLVEDEVGYLTRSFNRMTHSLRELNEGLEDQVRDRTQSLRDEIARSAQVQTSLATAKQEADAANRAKSVFLTNLSHELRNPLNAILGYAQIIQEQPAAGEQPAQIIERSGRHLLNLINTILDLAQIEAGKIELLAEPVSLMTFLERVADLAVVQAQTKGLAFSLERIIDPEVVVLTDPTRLRQVLINLLDNAISYTDQGGITFRISQSRSTKEGETGSGQGEFHFSVTDTGIGIDPQEQTRIFEAMYQTESARRRGRGTGLGLSICSQLVRQMGGEIRLESRPGQGSTFGFTLDMPLEEAVQNVAQPSHPWLAGAKNRRLLVVDDNPDNRNLLRALLEPAGFGVATARDAKEGLELALSQPFHAIITDILMPDVDGLQLIQALRNQPDTKSIPILATSAGIFPRDQARSLAVGAYAFLEKPFGRERLLALLAEMLDLSSQAEPEVAIPAPTGSSGDQTPPVDTVVSLLHLAQTGDILALQEKTDALARQMPNTLFTEQILLFVRTIQLERMIDWLETFLDFQLPEQQEVRL